MTIISDNINKKVRLFTELSFFIANFVSVHARHDYSHEYIINLKKNNMKDKELMMRAIELSEESVKNGGGPFGAVIARNGEIIAEGSNCVTLHHDPTAHAEVTAIRNAAEKLNSFDLSGCVIYTSCEPCPMCLGAIYWAHLDKIFYANDRKDAADIGFDDDFIYKELELTPDHRNKPSEIIMQEEAKKAFRMWSEKSDKTEY